MDCKGIIILPDSQIFFDFVSGNCKQFSLLALGKAFFREQPTAVRQG